jgi:hypothetical protein
LANKQINEEATKVLLEGNDFVILKVLGLRLALEDVPAVKFLSEEQVRNPVLRVEIKSAHEGRHRQGPWTSTLITTPEGLQPIISVLWKLKRTGRATGMFQGTISPSYPSDLCLSLNFKLSASVRCDALREMVLEPWELLHGIQDLAVAGDIEDCQDLRQSMLEVPFPAGVAFTLTKYHSMAQRELKQKNFSVARWWWTLYEDYWKHLGLVRRDPSVASEIKDRDNRDWNELWTETSGIYLQAKFGIVKMSLHQSKYQEVILNAADARHDRMFPFSRLCIFKRLDAKFHLSEALAHTALGRIKKGASSLSLATLILYNLAVGTDRNDDRDTEWEMRMMAEALRLSINMELIKLNSPYRCSLTPAFRVKPGIDLLPGMESRDFEGSTFWEMLESPEE